MQVDVLQVMKGNSTYTVSKNLSAHRFHMVNIEYEMSKWSAKKSYKNFCLWIYEPNFHLWFWKNPHALHFYTFLILLEMFN